MIRLLIVLLVVSGAAQGRDFLIETGDTSGLVRAVSLANANPGPDRIFLPVDATFVFKRPHRPDAATSLPPITGDLDIIGNQSVLRRYAEERFAHLEVAAGASVRVVDLVFTDGASGAVINRGDLLLWNVVLEDNAGATGGSALTNEGSARLADCEIRFNSFAGGGLHGGAIVNQGTLVIADTHIHDNSAHGGATGAELGAALSNFGHARLTRVTIDNNAATMTDGAGAIANFSPGELVLEDSVLTDNEPAQLATVRAAGEVRLAGTRIGSR